MSRKSPAPSPGDSSASSSANSKTAGESHREEVAREARATGVLVSGGSLSEYEVLKAIGKGKFSVVYRAKRKADQRLVAVKKVAIVDIMDKKTRDKCLKEVKLLQSLEHPNIIQYLDAFLSGQEEWSITKSEGSRGGGKVSAAPPSLSANNHSDLIIVLEWAEAGDLKRQLRKAIQKRARFEERIIWRYFAQIASAIGYMHSQRIMHRDLKPANIFLMADGTIKVGDLGLSRSLSENTLQAHSKVGTPLYMSPEVLRGNGYDFKSDVWSLGCILYELAALKSPFKEQGLNLYGLFQKINKGVYPPVPQPYSKTLTLLVRDMLSVDVSGRAEVTHVVEIAQRMREETERAKHEQRKRQKEQQQQRQQQGQQQEQQQQGQREEQQEEQREDKRQEERQEQLKHDVRGNDGQTYHDQQQKPPDGQKISEQTPSKSGRLLGAEERGHRQELQRDQEKKQNESPSHNENASQLQDGMKKEYRATPPSRRKSKNRPMSRERRAERRDRNERGDRPVRVPRPPAPDGASGERTERKTDQHEEQQAYKPRQEQAMSDRRLRDDRHKRQRQSGGTSSSRDVGAIYLMDLALEKLRLLDYYRHFIVAQTRMRAFTSVEFAVPRQASSHPGSSLSLQQHAEIAVRQEQLSDFLAVCSWLLNTYLACDWKEDDMRTAIENSRGLLAVLTDEIGLSPDAAAALTPHAISSGHGHSVCVLLNWILDKVLTRRSMVTLQRPDYSQVIEDAEVEEILGGEDDDPNDDAKILGDDTFDRGMDSDDDYAAGGKRSEHKSNSTGHSLGNAEDDAEEFYAGGIRRGPDADVTAPWDLDALFKLADGEAQKRWDTECERVRPKLQAMDKQIKGSLSGSGTMLSMVAWREHLQIARLHSRRIRAIQQLNDTVGRGGAGSGGGGITCKTAQNTINSTIQQFLRAPETMPWAQAILKIQRQEPLLERMYAPIISEWREAAERIAVLQKTVAERQEIVGLASQKVIETSEELSVVRESIQRIGEGVSDTSPVQRIRAAVRSIKAELRQMDLRTGVLQSRILRLQKTGIRKKHESRSPTNTYRRRR